MKIILFVLGLCLFLFGAATGETTRDSVASYLETIDSLSEERDIAGAKSLGRQALQVAESGLGPTDTLTTLVRLRLVTLHLDARAIDSARYHAEVARDNLGPAADRPSLARAETNKLLGVLEGMRGNAPEAVALFEQSVADFEALGLDTTLSAAQAMRNLATKSDDIGRLEESVYWHRKAMPLLKRHLGERHPSVAVSLAALGQTVYMMGQTARAELYMSEAVAMMKETMGPANPRLAGFMGNLAYVRNLRGRYAEAEATLKEALAILANIPGGDPRAERSVYTQYADVLRKTDRQDSAVVYFEKAYTAARQIGGDSSRVAAQAAGNLAQAKDVLGRFAEADSLWDISLGIHATISPVDSQSMLIGKYQRLLYYNRRPNTDVAERLAEVKTITDAMFGESIQPLAASSKEILAEVAINRGWHDIALEEATEALRIRYALVTEDAPYLNERDALDAAADLARARDLTLAALLAPTGKATLEPALADRLIAVKGLITEVMAHRRRQSREVADDESGAHAALIDVRREIASRFVGGSGDSRQQRERLRGLQRVADSLEAVLAVQTGRRAVSLNRSLDDLRASLARDRDILVDYLVIERPAAFRPDERERWLMASIWQACDEVTAVALAPMADVDTAFAALREHLLHISLQPGLPSASDEAEYRRLAGVFRDLVWSPLQANLCVEPTEVRVSPDGPLNLVPFAALPDGTTGYLGERLEIAVVAAPRRRREETTGADRKGLLALGDPAFEMAIGSESGSVATLRSGDDACRLDRRDTLSVLPLSRVEVETIARAWSEATGDSARILLGVEATEAAFRRAAPGNRVIHLATHGYYLDPACNQGSGAANREKADYHPLLLSGLFLAGANAESDSLTPEGDGVLSAYEILSLDLRGTAAVVLSACESGLGSAIPGEGVYGLRRAFLLAGAEQVICSLWPVPDRRTARFMSRLYARDAVSLAAGLAAEQREELRRLRESGRSTHPVSWAAFIAVR